MMNLQVCLVCVILCAVIPGVCCYDYNVVGLVVSSLIAFFLIIPIIAMLFMIVQWREWYERKQRRDGRIKMPREHWTIFPQKVKRSPTLASSPKSVRKIAMRKNNVMYTPGSRNTTLSRQEHPGAWLGPLPPVNKYEDKTQTLQFEPEEEPVLVAEILPDTQHGQMRNTQYRQTHVQNEQIFGGASTSSYQVTEQTDGQHGQTMYVSLNQNNPAQYARQTMPTRTVQSKPYHVQMTSVPYTGTSLSHTMAPSTSTTQVTRLSQTEVPSTSTTQAPRLSQTVDTTNGQGYSVFVPPTGDRGSPVEEGTAIFSFDSENEAEKTSPVAQSEDVVLF